jgi:triosephosphate isomerase
MRKNIAAGNWKMNKTLNEAVELVQGLLNANLNDNAEVVIAPPSLFVERLAELTKDYDQISIAAQNCYDQNSGAYTGEVSAEMIASTGAGHVIIGHSERRAYFSETNKTLAQKVDLALDAGLTPIFCCGESLEIREKGSHFGYVKRQLTSSLFHLSKEEISKIVIAYEPIWAIGTGKTATSQQAQDMHLALRNHLAKKYGKEVAGNISILYGGSVKPANAKELFGQPDVDGGLVGGASLKKEDFVSIINSF